ncbi:MAG TPA: class I lanthipeptide [Bacteroidia bacterium]|nr:class I lanthipeptide [Bacteroidia bacterium]HRG52255.1 class I lanthipeptide [Bacteroidia bacterium]
MKKIKIEKKLSLSKETIAKLNAEKMTEIIGGGTATCGPTVGPACPSNQGPACASYNQPGGCPGYTVNNCATNAGC